MVFHLNGEGSQRGDPPVTRPVSAMFSLSPVEDHLSSVRSDSSLSATNVDSSPSGVEIDIWNKGGQ